MRGQAFEVFKILMGAVIAVVLLIIAMGATGNIVYPEQGFEAAARLINQAKRAPGECFAADRIKFSQGEYADLSNIVKFPVTVSVEPPFADVMQASVPAGGTSASAILVKKDATIKVSARCDTSSCAVRIGAGSC
ncbi:hypothetical protein HYS54_04215 [Candidatus Micrarchaeota archaeon]|nr:hypothetical protein [Candidatus Micrarchaeota archaeon]